jgi:hypothetical protein
MPVLEYNPIPTLQLFHESDAERRCIVGPVGSGKSSAASLEIGYYLPHHVSGKYGIKKTRWAIIRNTYVELIRTTKRTFEEWHPWARWVPSERAFHLNYPGGIEAEYLLQSCDRPEDIKKIKGLEVTGFLIDESIEVREEIKRMIKNRDGRFPKRCPVRYGIEITNPPDIEHPLYWQYEWQVHPPGPNPPRRPLVGHKGFWQPPRENEANLRPGYYNGLIEDYQANHDWISMYVEGKPGITLKGKAVFNNFRRNIHVATESLKWRGGTLYLGWDDSGNMPAAVVGQLAGPMQLEILKEYWSDKDGIVDFGKKLSEDLNEVFQAVDLKHWGDPAGENKYSRPGGGFTSNADLLRTECGINVIPAEQNPIVRIQSVDQLMMRINGFIVDPSCTRLIDALQGGYHYAERMNAPGDFMSNPEKNRYSHVAEALEYLVVSLFVAGRRNEKRDAEDQANFGSGIPQEDEDPRRG